ncbi:P-loop containing nucleoside triphosphate hydrolases superfamily protein [Hibiscus syriacus]|uniref:P-loop containing nucleoside triphosphate hydrolases superfamily protein n=1 Tax=Hibiscus syriacus TaxID=106335 RepID=A0A6A3CS07_HIBSY|nr:P-loop containing nucleoside triphosphate hydrolases superfamily protein [Hibiscus syriacus]
MSDEFDFNNAGICEIGPAGNRPSYEHSPVMNPIPVSPSVIVNYKVHAASSFNNNGDGNVASSATLLITFLGKGGSGKTTASVFAAQHYAMSGLSTCLVLQGQDRTAEGLLNCKIDSSPVLFSDNLSVVRLETTKMLLESLSCWRRAWGASWFIFSALVVERLLGLFGKWAQNNHQKDKFDMIIYDGISTEETLRMIGASSKATLYFKYLRSMAEKTDLGRLAGPSLLRLVDDAMGISGKPSQLNGTFSAEIWDSLEQILEVTMDFILSFPTLEVSGAFSVATPHLDVESVEKMKDFSPLPFAFIPNLSMGSSQDWNAIKLKSTAKGARDLLSLPAGQKHTLVPSIYFDTSGKSVTLLMPGFEKSDIKLYQECSVLIPSIPSSSLIVFKVSSLKILLNRNLSPDGGFAV